MASSVEYLECERCGGFAFYELNCRTLEEWKRCERCGCGYDYELRYNKKNEVVLDWKKKPKFRFRKYKGFGIAHYAFKNGGSVSYQLLKPLSKKDKKKFFLDIETKAEIDKQKSFLTVWDKKKKQIISLYGDIPPSFDEPQEVFYEEPEMGEGEKL